MKLIILSKEHASIFTPSEVTDVLRIHNSSGTGYPPLRHNPLFRKVVSFVFDDIDIVSNPGLSDRLRGRNTVIDRRTASAVMGFVSDSLTAGVPTMIIHCDAGLRRSPAVALAVMKRMPEVAVTLVPEYMTRGVDDLVTAEDMFSDHGCEGSGTMVPVDAEGLKRMYHFYDKHVFNTLLGAETTSVPRRLGL